MPVVDSFQIHEIFSHNSYCAPVPRTDSNKPFPYVEYDEDRTLRGPGLWCTTSYANHCCLSNATRAFLGDLLLLRAVKDIRKDDEIFTSYTGPAGSKRLRDQLRKAYSFTCDCALCRVEMQVSEKTQASRFSLLERLNEAALQGPLVERIKTERTIRDLELTYDPQLYQGLPQIVIAKADLALALLRETVGLFDKAAAAHLQFARCYGYIIDTKATPMVLDTSNVVVNRFAVKSLWCVTEDKRKAGKVKAAEQFERIAKDAYLMLVGFITGFDKLSVGFESL